jgi:hypothetical protein
MSSNTVACISKSKAQALILLILHSLTSLNHDTMILFLQIHSNSSHMSSLLKLQRVSYRHTANLQRYPTGINPYHSCSSWVAQTLHQRSYFSVSSSLRQLTQNTRNIPPWQRKRYVWPLCVTAYVFPDESPFLKRPLHVTDIHRSRLSKPQRRTPKKRRLCAGS